MDIEAFKAKLLETFQEFQEVMAQYPECATMSEDDWWEQWVAHSMG